MEGTIGLRQPDGTFLTIVDPVGSIPVAIVHGRQDDHIPYEGGQGGAPDYLYVKSVDDAVGFWTEANRCQGGSETQAGPDGNVVTTRYAGCFANSDVVLFAVGDGVHAWPTAANNRGFSATDAIREFFAKHPRT